MSAFPLQISQAGKTPNPCTKPAMKILVYPGQDPACGGLETLSERGAGKMCLTSTFHPPPMPQMEKYLLWKAEGANTETESERGLGKPWGKGALPTAGGKLQGIPTLYGCTALYSLERDFPSGTSVRCSQTFEVGPAGASILQMREPRLRETKLASSRGRTRTWCPDCSRALLNPPFGPGHLLSM